MSFFIIGFEPRKSASHKRRSVNIAKERKTLNSEYFEQLIIITSFVVDYITAMSFETLIRKIGCLLESSQRSSYYSSVRCRMTDNFSYSRL